MLDKPNGEPRREISVEGGLSGASPFRTTIEELARQAQSDHADLENFNLRPVIVARELRKLWNARLRPFWRLHLGAYQAITKRFVELGENYLAIETAAEGVEFFGDDPKLILSSSLALARCGAIDRAQQILLEKKPILSGASEYLSLIARTHKDLWKVSGDVHELEEAYRCYKEDYLQEKMRSSRRAAFPGANAASMALLLGKGDEARRIAQEVLATLDPKSSDYWEQVTGAECELVIGDVESSWQRYSAAVATSAQPYANLMTSRAQVRLLLPVVGWDPRAFDSCFPIPKVACFSGHRLDESNRGEPRFPAEFAPALKERIRSTVKKLGVGLGYSSAANGADILFLEAMQETENGKSARETFITLPVPEAEFIEVSVLHSSSSEWLDRFRNVMDRATAVSRIDPGLPPSGIVFEYANELSFGAACQKAKELDTELIVLALWDGRRTDDRGGTAHLIRMAALSGRRVEIISPNPSLDTPAQIETALPDTRDSTSQVEILHGLAFSVGEPDEPRAVELVAAVLRNLTPVATEVHGRCFYIFFDSCEVAGRAALSILASVGPHLEHSLGLHSLPVRKRIHPVSGAPTFSPGLIQKAEELGKLDPRSQIYATMGFAALSEKAGISDFRCEFLGHRVLADRHSSEPIFRIVSSLT